MLKRATHSAQSGIALIEALVALAILAGTLLGLLYVHLHTIADTESALRRTQALHLIDDLAERIRSNPNGFAELASYRSDWGSTPTSDVDCEALACGPGQLARWDLARWNANVVHALPQGKAVVFDPPGGPPGAPLRMLSVMVGWKTRGEDGFELTVPGASCPASHLCQFGHVQP